MSEKVFDQLLKSKLNDPDFLYADHDYQIMNNSLKAAREKKPSGKIIFFITSVAACLLVVIVISALSNNHKKAQPELVSNQNPSLNQKPLTTTPVIEPTSIINVQAIENNKLPNEAHATTKYVASIKAPHPILKPTLTNPKPPQPTIETVNKLSTQTVNKTVAFNNPKTVDELVLTTANNIANQATIIPNNSKRINISVAGGINYGATNQGYMVGACITKSLNHKLYIEANIAYASGSNQRVVNAYNAPPPPFTGTYAVAPAATVQEGSNYFNYLQVSPILGFNVHKKLALGFGPDLQHLMQSNSPSTASNTFDNGTSTETGKILPDMDYGFVGKTEYAITSRLRAGLQYRQALNNVLSNTNKYLDRNYFQVQIKYSLLNR